MTKLGPWVRAAILCEFISVDQTNMKTLFHIHDNLIVEGIVDDPAAPMAPFNVSRLLFFSMMPGELIGRITVRLVLSRPDGTEQVLHHGFAVNLARDGSPSDGHIQLNFEILHEGQHWIDIYFEGSLLTRSPLRINYQPVLKRGQTE